MGLSSGAYIGIIVGIVVFIVLKTGKLAKKMVPIDRLTSKLHFNFNACLWCYMKGLTPA